MIDSQTQELRAIAEQAADWYLRIEEEGHVPFAERQAFIQWLKASPAHIEEFMRVRAVHTQLHELSAIELPDVDELLQQVPSNVISLTNKDDQRLQTVAVQHKPIFWATAASIVTIALSLTLFVVSWSPSTSKGTLANSVYETALGEQRSALLSDGSVIELNTQSKLRVLFTDELRLVELTKGEAVFDVTRDTERPFRVDAGSAIVEAIGTRFNVYRQASQTVVTVVEGHVAISRPETDISNPDTGKLGTFVNSSPIQLAPGDQVAVSSAGKISLPAVVETNQAIAWTERRLVFDGDSLATVARELNRYNYQQLVIADPTLAQQTISGVFYANDPDALFAFLEAVGNMRVETDPAGGSWVLYPSAVTMTESH